MPPHRTAEPTPLKLPRTIIGKRATSFTVEECQRILQEYNVEYTKRDRKIDLLVKLAKCATDNNVTQRKRLDIMQYPLGRQHIRWQHLDDDGMPRQSSYPTGTIEMVQHAIEGALAADEARRQGASSKVCSGCRTRQSELNFPTSIGKCCDSTSTHCRACLDNRIRAEVSVASMIQRTSDTQANMSDIDSGTTPAVDTAIVPATIIINCPMCNASMASRDIKALATAATYEKLV